MARPPFQNNETILNLIYTYNAAPFTITPYFQFTNAASSIGAMTSASTYGGAILVNYSFGEDSPLPGFSLPIRFEYIATTGNSANGAEPSVRSGKQCVVGHRDADLSVQDLVCARRVLLCRGEQHHTGTGLQLERRQYDADPPSIRNRHFVLSRPENRAAISGRLRFCGKDGESPPRAPE